MHPADQPVVEVLGDTLALMTRRERGVWSLHDTNAGILAIANVRFKARPHINHPLSQVGLSVRSLTGILAEGWFDDISNGTETLLRPTPCVSPVRVIEQLLQASTERCRKAGRPGRIEQTNTDHVEDVNSVFELLSARCLR